MPQKVVITDADVQDAVRSGTYTIQVRGEYIITPLAASSLKEKGVSLVQVGEVTSLAAGSISPDAPINIAGRDPRLLLNMYGTMCRIRAFEETLGILFREKHLVGFLHLSIGQEAVPTGVCAALNPDDYLTLTHRGHGMMVARGLDLNKMMAELLGRVTGYNRGKAGSVHLADFQSGILGANGIIGASIVIAVGAAMSAKMRQSRQVAVAIFGDGAVNQGAFHEALNYASIKKLPVVFVCENNQYAVSMSAEQAVAAKSIAARGASYQIPSLRVDGQNVLEVYDAMAEAVARARIGHGPSFLECLTYRTRGHWEGETTDLRSEEEKASWRRRDPIKRLENALLENRLATKDDLDGIYDGIVREISEAVRFAEASPYPGPEEALLHVYADR